MTNEGPSVLNRVLTCFFALCGSVGLTFATYHMATPYHSVAIGMLIIPIAVGFALYYGAAGVGLAGSVLVYAVLQQAVGYRMSNKLMGLDKVAEEPDFLQQQMEKLNQDLEEADSDDKIYALMQIAEQRKRFVKLRRVIFALVALLSIFPTAFAYWDLMQLKAGKPSVVVPEVFWDTKSENALLVFFGSFVLLAVPLSVIFLHYRIQFLAMVTAISLYAGIAFHFIYLGNVQYPKYPWYSLPIVLWIIFAGLGLLAEWVDLDDTNTA